MKILLCTRLSRYRVQRYLLYPPVEQVFLRWFWLLRPIIKVMHQTLMPRYMERQFRHDLFYLPLCRFLFWLVDIIFFCILEQMILIVVGWGPHLWNFVTLVYFIYRFLSYNCVLHGLCEWLSLWLLVFIENDFEKFQKICATSYVGWMWLFLCKFES